MQASYLISLDVACRLHKNLLPMVKPWLGSKTLLDVAGSLNCERSIVPEIIAFLKTVLCIVLLCRKRQRRRSYLLGPSQYSQCQSKTTPRFVCLSQCVVCARELMCSLSENCCFGKTVRNRFVDFLQDCDEEDPFCKLQLGCHLLPWYACRCRVFSQWHSPSVTDTRCLDCHLLPWYACGCRHFLTGILPGWLIQGVWISVVTNRMWASCTRCSSIVGTTRSC